MTSVRSITRDRFELFVKRTEFPQTQERSWFATTNDKTLGVVVFDGNDSDWTYVVLEQAKDKVYRWVEGQSCIASQEEATNQLKTAMEKR